MIYQNLQGLIGNTPIVELHHFDTGVCRLFVKMESFNPGGSIKDRIALSMVTAAEQEGKLKAGGTIVEATAGNTGLALAQVAALKGYQMIVVMPDKMSKEKISHMQATGAQVIITRSDVHKGHPEYYQDLAATIAKERNNAVYINQFANAANPKAHEESTGPEIWQQMAHKLDAVVCGVGTGGHMTGIGRYLQCVAPQVEMILGDPVGSALASFINPDSVQEEGRWLVEGIGQDYVPVICDIKLLKKVYKVNDEQAFATARELLRKEGIFAGSSTGTVVHAALQYCQEQTTPKNVMTFVYDSGSKYLSKMYNDEWLRERGFTI